MEYDPRFLEQWHADLEPKHASTARADVLARYAASLGRTDFHAKAPFKDVREVRLSLDDAQRERLLAVCAAAGHEIEQHENSWTIFGPQFRIQLESSTAAGAVTAIELELREPLTREPLKLGRTTLTFHEKTATLTLN